ncbi:hypothetical protein BTP_4416 [Burkholderia thailandensis Phuket 4W-1]|nr:hypothetical protein BTN_4520 [Burkholderia thailandensis E254]KIS54413.1 hypothetical protein BTP_4416 [Burkholderia thailandensis Phuket 4W-1]
MPTAAAIRGAASRRAERTTRLSAAPRSENTSCPATLPAGTAGARDGQCVTDAARRRRPRASRDARRSARRGGSTARSPSRTGSLSVEWASTRSKAPACSGARVLPARSDAARAISGRRGGLRILVRRSRTNASRRAGSPPSPGIARHCDARRQAISALARRTSRRRLDGVARHASARRARRNRPAPRAARKLIDPRPACPPSPTRRAAPR